MLRRDPQRAGVEPSSPAAFRPLNPFRRPLCSSAEAGALAATRARTDLLFQVKLVAAMGWIIYKYLAGLFTYDLK
jgi:hypothetical protein